jgi:hypothetical protein
MDHNCPLIYTLLLLLFYKGLAGYQRERVTDQALLIILLTTFELYHMYWVLLFSAHEYVGQGEG